MMSKIIYLNITLARERTSISLKKKKKSTKTYRSVEQN